MFVTALNKNQRQKRRQKFVTVERDSSTNFLRKPKVFFDFCSLKNELKIPQD